MLIRATCSHIIQEVNGSHVIPVQQGTWLLARVQGVLIRAACSHTIQVKWMSHDPLQQETWPLTTVMGVLIRAACSHIIQELNGSHVIRVQQGTRT